MNIISDSIKQTIIIQYHEYNIFHVSCTCTIITLKIMEDISLFLYYNSAPSFNYNLIANLPYAHYP